MNSRARLHRNRRQGGGAPLPGTNSTTAGGRRVDQSKLACIDEKMRKAFHTTLTLQAMIFICATLSLAQNFTDVKPSPQQVAWQDLEMGALIHFGPNTFMDREWGDGTADPAVFNPSNVDPEQWMRAAKSAGIRYVVLVAKHHDGFCLWPTAKTQYSIKSSPWK